MDNNPVAIKLLPVCECGYIFKELTVTEALDIGGSTFAPNHCPNCKGIIKSVSITHDFRNGEKRFS
jgi:hypothetical protein